MNKDEYAKPIPFKEGIELIKNKTSIGFIWVTVINSIGCIFEIGGSSYKCFTLKAHIYHYTDNDVLFYKNNQAQLNYSLSVYGVETSSTQYRFERSFTDDDEFIKYLDKTDFRLNPIKLTKEEYTVIKYKNVAKI